MMQKVKFNGIILDFLFFLKAYIKRRQTPKASTFSPQFSVQEPDIESITESTRFANFQIKPSSSILEWEVLEVLASQLPDKATLLTVTIKVSELMGGPYGHQIQVDQLNAAFGRSSSGKKLWNDIVSELAEQGWLPENNLTESEEYNLQQLRQLLQNRFNLSEVKDLCFELGINFENLGESTLNGSIRELIIRMEKTGRVADLITICKQLRPDLDL